MNDALLMINRSRKLLSPSLLIMGRLRVIHALLMKDAVGRFGHDNLGFFWVVGEPLLFTMGVIVAWSLIHASHGEGVGVVSFALTGYSYITMWRHITARSMGTVGRRGRLAYFSRIQVFDPILAMAALEVLACFSAFVVAYVPLSLFGFCPPVSDPLVLVMAYLLSGLFAFGMGMILCGLASLNKVLHHVVPAIMYVTLPLTGVFTMQEWLPERVRSVLSWSPLINGIEMFRAGLFPPDVPTHWSVEYLVMSDIVTLIVGYWLFVVGTRCHADD